MGDFTDWIGLDCIKQIKSNQIKSNQIKSNQIKSNQIKIGFRQRLEHLLDKLRQKKN